jgi:hypothetical protein
MAGTAAGVFESAEAADLAIQDLRAAGFETIDRRNTADATLVMVHASERETEALQIMAKHSPRSLQREHGELIGDVSDAPRAGDDAPVVTEPIPAAEGKDR